MHFWHSKLKVWVRVRRILVKKWWSRERICWAFERGDCGFWWQRQWPRRAWILPSVTLSSSTTMSATKSHSFSAGVFPLLLSNFGQKLTVYNISQYDLLPQNLILQKFRSTSFQIHMDILGRGRAKQSRCLLLTSDAGIYKKEETNTVRELLMSDAMNKIDQLPSEWFLNRVGF